MIFKSPQLNRALLTGWNHIAKVHVGAHGGSKIIFFFCLVVGLKLQGWCEEVPYHCSDGRQPFRDVSLVVFLLFPVIISTNVVAMTEL